MISVVIPTMPGRDLETCMEGYIKSTHHPIEFIPVKDADTCGEGWTRGADMATGDYIHMTADDMTPEIGWVDAAIEAVDRGYYPAPKVIERDREQYWGGECWEPDDYALSMNDDQYSFVPFMSRQMWQETRPVVPLTYGSDKWIAERMDVAGYPCVVRHGYTMTHRPHPAGRVQGDWRREDFTTFDLVFAYREYSLGQRDPSEPHPLRKTPEGLAMVRDWYRDHIDPLYPRDESESTA